LKNNIFYNILLFENKKKKNKYFKINNYINKFKIESFLILYNKILIFYSNIINIKLIVNYFNYSFFYSNLGVKDQKVILENFFNKFDLFNQILVTINKL
jgi:hypothetical protein